MRTVVVSLLIIGILAVSGCTQTAPHGTAPEPCDSNIPINRLNVQIVDDFGEMKENVSVVAYGRTVLQGETPVAIGITDEKGKVTLNYSFLPDEEYGFNALGEDILPEFWNIHIPCFSLSCENVTMLTDDNSTVGLEYDLRLEFRRWGYPQITFYDDWYQEADVISVYKKSEAQGEIVLEEVDGIIYDPVLEFRFNRSVEAFVFVQGIADDRLCYEECEFHLSHEDLSENNKYFSISFLREYCGEIGEVCLDDSFRPIEFNGERIWLDRDADCIPIVQECGS